MKRRVRLYIEGGATGRTADHDFRRGWKKFLNELHELARQHGYHSLEVVRGKGRGNAYKKFVHHKNDHPDDLCVLLVDSETAVAVRYEVWDVAAQREGDQWRRPRWAKADHLFLMVQFVESWLLTDTDALRTYFRDGFRADRLPTTNLEQRTKAEIEQALHSATQDTRKGPYQHGQAHEIMEFVRPDRVRTLAHGLRLFDTLERMITA